MRLNKFLKTITATLLFTSFSSVYAAAPSDVYSTPEAQEAFLQKTFPGQLSKINARQALIDTLMSSLQQGDNAHSRAISDAVEGSLIYRSELQVDASAGELPIEMATVVNQTTLEAVVAKSAKGRVLAQILGHRVNPYGALLKSVAAGTLFTEDGTYKGERYRPRLGAQHEFTLESTNGAVAAELAMEKHHIEFIEPGTALYIPGVLAFADMNTQAPLLVFDLAYTAADYCGYKDDIRNPERFPKEIADEDTKRKLHERAAQNFRAVLNAAVDKDIRHVVLGALGCGIYRNPTEVVAKAAAEVLSDEVYRGKFDSVTFAISGEGERNDTLRMLFSSAFEAKKESLSN